MPKRPEISQEMIRLYDEYTHLTYDRRDFMRRLTALAGSASAAAAIAPLIAADRAGAAMVAPDDERVKAERITFEGADGTEMSGYLALPRGGGARTPTVMVIHENRGLNAHIEDVARRTALAGFVALAPDFLSPAGGTPPDEDKARQMIGELDAAATVANAVATVDYLKERPDGNGRVGAIGFCWGGGLVNQVAIHAGEDLSAGVAFYGRTPDSSEVGKIRAALLLHYAGLDERINAGLPAYEEALEKAGVAHEIHVYDGVNHAFHNDTSAARYDEKAARLAWERTIAFLKEKLAG
ncbi:dienelactone hydrolase family protein [Afifella sp. IM 167]|uniref:dienelactone hydrolase family protein n=1 Tax=Afifella sp. IM 167 TaxID=2033586 RepID=UPI001CCD158B|nr:dienelactone hydrolase family protein [Afifella sp. IM 167]MBZ8134921.1 carboxymethylenebutenolidase [Afifella sp. IM 167]